MSRKYKQRGYQDSDKPERTEKPRERPQEGRRPHDHLGPRTPRMVGTVNRARCSNCGAVLVPGFDVKGECPKCGLELHCCKQCVHFDTAARFECTQPITERITKKDKHNECSFFVFRVTIEKDTAPISPTTASAPTETIRPNDARKAFEDLFKK